MISTNRISSIHFQSGFKLRGVNKDKATPATEFSKKWFQHADIDNVCLDRSTIIGAAERITGYKIHDFGNTTNSDLQMFISSLITKKTENEPWIKIPPDIVHIVVGHGVGVGESWRFKNSNTKVLDYINGVVPKGMNALVVVCSDTHKPKFANCDGVIVKSGDNRSKN